MKYPRTYPLEGSRPDGIPFSTIQNQYLVIEEKIDGRDTGIYFNDDAECTIISRNSNATDDPEYKQLKDWCNSHLDGLWDILNSRYIMYGQWCLSKHTVFYDALPSLFLEHDLYDRDHGYFLSTKKRGEILNRFFYSVPVLGSGYFDRLDAISNLLEVSKFKTDHWKETLQEICRQRKIDFDIVLSETDPSMLMEGLFIKVENDDQVLSCYKYVRQDFVDLIISSKTHWKDREFIPNGIHILFVSNRI